MLLFICDCRRVPLETGVINIVSAALMTAFPALTYCQHTLHAGVERFQPSAGDFEDLTVTMLLKSLFNTLSVLYVRVCSAFMSIMMTLRACFESVFQLRLLSFLCLHVSCCVGFYLIHDSVIDFYFFFIQEQWMVLVLIYVNNLTLLKLYCVTFFFFNNERPLHSSHCQVRCYKAN